MTNILLETLKSALYTPYLKNGRIVNMLIIAEPESGKTTSLKKVSIYNNGILYVSDLTYMMLMKILSDVYNDRKDVKTIIIGDMLKIFGRKLSTALNIVTALNELMEEGIRTIYIGGDKFVDIGKYIKIQIIGALTEIPKGNIIMKIATTGFLTRVLPFSYSLSKKKVMELFEKIVSRDYSDLEPIKLEFPKEPVEVKISKELASSLVPLATVLAEEVSEAIKAKVKGIRYLDMLISLAQGRALSEGRTEVTEEDINFIKEAADYFNFKFNVIK